MVQATNLGLGNYAPATLCRRSMTGWCPLGKGEMGTRIIIIAHVCIDHPLELILADRDNVVGVFAPDAPDNALAVAVLPRGASGADDLIKFEDVNTS